MMGIPNLVLGSGMDSFAMMRKKNAYYVDKTGYIPLLENLPEKAFTMLRPRKFGKSLFLSMLETYYDIAHEDKFESLFSGLEIMHHLTQEHSKYQILHFDFSKIKSGNISNLPDEFNKYCNKRLNDFMIKYERFYDERFKREFFNLDTPSLKIDSLKYARDNYDFKYYFIIDEYDNFTNDVLNANGKGVYEKITHGDGFLRNSFKDYKDSFSRIMIFGILPITINDLTSGYNIGEDISFLPQFNSMLGFSKEEVKTLIVKFQNQGKLQEIDAEQLVMEITPWYNNYCFSEGALKQERVFNCEMVLHFLRSLLMWGKAPKNMICKNTLFDYNKLDSLIDKNSKRIFEKIVAMDSVSSKISPSFSALEIRKNYNFISLLYYYGLLTITGYSLGQYILSIPNLNIKSEQYEYIGNRILEKAQVTADRLEEEIKYMSQDGKYKKCLENVADIYTATYSNRDLKDHEYVPQGVIAAILYCCGSQYIVRKESELNGGYCDIILTPSLDSFADVNHSYIIETKICRNKTELNSVLKQAESQLRKYQNDKQIKKAIGKTRLHLLAMILSAGKLICLQEFHLPDQR